ncbi:uncharacterized protein BYT42DRAFT_342256 [Radiomyces spectabilis]|uniref:uncharacterized protein n=1 Tax=Radiomyces spectabilis TaxID=64574 RepID=UPI00222029C8|nr:uncharacterized protein BYT42DRAFT_342256 [Radiomyces spectabilis]KAI8377393.1 hypothetical protein BYT42DRAFT_342256 [Radiomyces spectabilis]
MTSPPTLAECNEWVCEHSAALMSNVASRQDVAMLLDSLQILVEALDAPLAVLEPLKGRVRQLKKRLANQQDQTQLKDVLRHIQELGQECQTIVDKPTSFVKKDPSPNYYIEPNRILPSRTRAQQYAHPWPDQIDTKAYWFRQYFVGKPYVTLIGPLSPSSVPKEEQEHAIISIVREHEKEFAKKDSVSFVGNRYRVIVRGKETFLSRQVVHETVAKAVQVRLEAVGMADCLDCKAPKPKRSRPLRTFSSALSNGPQPNSMTRTMRAALLAIYPDVDLRCFHELSAEETILAGLEKEFLRFDEIGIPRNYKFGVLTIRKDQKTEEEWFNNSGMSDDLREFLETLGTCVQLKGYKGYAAGLDPKTGESGDISYMTTWEDHDIMFHVAPLMPARDNDRQQVHRKRYIGNDIVCLVFIEGDSSEFHFNAIRSQFLHVYILVHAETVAGQRAWRIEVVRHKNVPEFGPHIPSPPLFYNKEELKRFLTVKCKSF